MKFILVFLIVFTSSAFGVDFATYLASKENMTFEQIQFSYVKQKIKRGFEDICGDTYCEGDFSTIIPQEFKCEFDEDLKMITFCSWTFDAFEGDESKFYDCYFDINTDSQSFMRKLELSPLEYVLDKKLSNQTSLNDVLMKCLI